MFAMQQVTRGGGILFATLRHTAESGRADVAADYGTLRRISFSVKNTVIDGNTADEGGGMWSGWPVQVHNCSISNNTAVAAVSVVACSVSQNNTGGQNHSSPVANRVVQWQLHTCSSTGQYGVFDNGHRYRSTCWK